MGTRIHFIVLFALSIPLSSAAQQPLVQFIHNSADSALPSVDIHMDSVLVADDLAFRNATAYVQVTPGTHQLYITTPDSADTLGTFSHTFQSSLSYAAVLNGIYSNTGYTPAPPLSLHVAADVHHQSSLSGYTDVMIFNGSTDAPALDFMETTLIGTTLAENLHYGTFDGYDTVEPFNYRIRLRDSLAGEFIGEFKAALASLGLADSATLLLSSGFLDPALNSNGPAIGLFMTSSAGGALLELPGCTARVQVIHNSADSAVDQIDVYAGGTLIRNNLPFRQASAYIEVPSGKNLPLVIAPDTSTGPGTVLTDTTVVLDSEKTYVLVLNGVAGTAFQPVRPLGLMVLPSREQALLGYNTDLMIIHGSTDAPAFNIREWKVLNTTWVNNANYGTATSYLEWPSAQYSLLVEDAGTLDTLAAYVPDLSAPAFAGKAVVVIASGFVDTALNSNGPSFGLWAATPAGGSLTELMQPAGVESLSTRTLHVYPNPTAGVIALPGAGSVSVIDICGHTVLQGETSGTRFDLQSLPNGFYHLRFTDHRGTTSCTMIVQH